jgi:hypothetical protein
MRELLARHLKSFYPIPPMEVTPEGKCFTNICFVLQHEPYLGCEAIYQGYVEDGLEVHRRIYEAAWDLNWSPWNCPLNIESPHGRQSWLLSYMTNPAVWHILPALSGTTVNLPRQELLFRPTAAYHGPLFFPTFWGWLDCEPGSARVKVLKVFSDVGPAAKVDRLTLVNGVKKELDVRAGALWDLSEFAKIPPSKAAVAPRFPTSRPQREPRPWHLRSSEDKSFDTPAIETIGAIDGDPLTCWWTRKAMQPGDWLQVDLLKEQEIHGLRFDHRAGAGEHPRGLRVEVSTDGKTWRQAAELTEPQVLAALKEGILTIPFEATARYLKLTQLGQARARWSVYDLDLQ